MGERYDFCDAPCPTQGMWPMGLGCDAPCDKPLGHTGAHECPHGHRMYGKPHDTEFPK